MKIYVLIICLSLFLYSCTSFIKETAYPTLGDGKYDSEFPYKNTSNELEEITRSVRMLNVMSFYKGYAFDKITNMNLSDLSEDLLNSASQQLSFHQTSSGTATIIYNNLGRIALLSCAHIVDYPDTIITYYLDEKGNKTNFIETISFKLKQNNYIPELPINEELELIISDAKLDLAILSARVSEFEKNEFPILNYPVGYSKELEWGSFVYAFGYPLGQKMVTKGIVSNPNMDGKGGFLIDANFNKGFSGGIVLAIRDGVPNFEIVGLVKNLPAEFEYNLRPSEEKIKEGISPLLPYEGEVYVEVEKAIKYGVTKVLPVEWIVEYLKENQEYLSDQNIILKYSIFSQHFDD